MLNRGPARGVGPCLGAIGISESEPVDQDQVRVNET